MEAAKKSGSERERNHPKHTPSGSAGRLKSGSLDKKLPRSRSPERRQERPSSPHDESKRPEERSRKGSGDRVVKMGKMEHMSYEEEGVLKASVHIVLPDYLITHIIGKEKATINSIVNESGCVIRFLSDVCHFIESVGTSCPH
jgi:hypothetical protein